MLRRGAFIKARGDGGGWARRGEVRVNTQNGVKCDIVGARSLALYGNLLISGAAADSGIKVAV